MHSWRRSAFVPLTANIFMEAPDCLPLDPLRLVVDEDDLLVEVLEQGVGGCSLVVGGMEGLERLSRLVLVVERLEVGFALGCVVSSLSCRSWSFCSVDRI